MEKSVYKLFMGKRKEAWYQLSEERQHDLLSKVNGAVEKAGGKRLIMCDPFWSTEQWHYWGVDEFPDIAAVMKHTQLLSDLNWDRYVETMTVLGTK